MIQINHAAAATFPLGTSRWLVFLHIDKNFEFLEPKPFLEVKNPVTARY